MPHPKTADDVCNNCIHFKSHATIAAQQASGSDGECRRYPPQAIPLRNGDGAFVWRFPLVLEGMWCGEFEDKR